MRRTLPADLATMTRRADVPPITLEVRTRADPATAWRAITEPEWLARWLTDASPVGAVGSAYRLDFGDGSMVEGEVVAVEPGRRFVHRWAWHDAELGEVTTVEWTVEPLADGGARIGLVHGGWDEAGGNVVARDDHEGYWSSYLDDLRDILDEA